MRKVPALLLVSILAPSLVYADASEAIAGPNCKKPIPPSALRKADDTSDFDQKFEDYRNCIQAYAADQRTLAQQHIDAGNAAIDDLNAFIAQMNERLKN